MARCVLGRSWRDRLLRVLHLVAWSVFGRAWRRRFSAVLHPLAGCAAGRAGRCPLGKRGRSKKHGAGND